MNTTTDKFDELSFGDIFFFDNLIFDDGTDRSNDKLPCVFLCNIGDHVYAMKLSGNRRKYSRDKEKYIKLNKQHEIDYRTLYLINVRNIIKHKKHHVCGVISILQEDDMNTLKDAIKTLGKAEKKYKLILDKINLESELQETEEIESSSQDDKTSKTIKEHVVGMSELFPNGTGRTKEEFENDNKYIYDSFTLKYKTTMDKQQ